MEKQASVSKSMNKVESKTHMGASAQWWYVLTIWLSVSLALVYPIANRSIVYPQIFIILFILIFWWIIFLIYFRNTPKQDHTVLHIKYLYRAYTGKTLIMKYVVPVRTIENIIPIREVFDHGIIKFKYGRWGMILREVSNQIDNDDLMFHLDIIKSVLDSLPDDIVIKVISSSYVDLENNLELSLLDLSNDKSKTVQQREHLYELYQEIAKDDSDKIDWRTMIFINFGKHPDFESAEIKMQEFLPGFIDGLSRAEAYCVPVVDENDITLLYRKLAMVI